MLRINENDRVQSTFRPALMLMTGRAIAFAVTFFVPVFLVRFFTPTEFGTYKQFFLVVYMAYNIGQMGMAESLFYFLPTSPECAGRFVVNSLIILASIGSLCVLAFSAFSSAIALRLSNSGLQTFLPLAGVYLLFMLTGCVLEIILISRNRFQWATASYVVSDLLRAAFLFAPVIIFKSLNAVLLGGLAFALVRTLTACGYIRREFRHGLRPDWDLLKRQLAYTLPFSLSVLVGVATNNYHQIAVSSFFDAATFAIYSIGCLQIPLVDFMATPASNVMMVRMAEEVREGRPSALLSIWHDTTRKLALVFFPLVGLLIVNARSLILFLFTDRYAASIPIFMVWSLSILFAAFQTDGVMRVFAQTRFLIVMNIARLAAIVAAMGWCLRHFNLIGAVMVTLLGMFVAKALAMVRMSRLMQVSLADLTPWKSLGMILTTSMIAAIPVVALNTELRLGPLFLLPISGVVYLLVYSVLVLSLGILTESEKQAVFAQMARFAVQRVRRPEQ